MDEWFKHVPYWFCILLLLVLFALRWTAPVVSKSINDVAVPSITIKQTPLMGCSLSRIHNEVLWQ